MNATWEWNSRATCFCPVIRVAFVLSHGPMNIGYEPSLSLYESLSTGESNLEHIPWEKDLKLSQEKEKQSYLSLE
jgi:hypothetical protein